MPRGEALAGEAFLAGRRGEASWQVLQIFFFGKNEGLVFFCFLKNGEVDGRGFFSLIFFSRFHVDLLNICRFRIPAHQLIDPFFFS